MFKLSLRTLWRKKSFSLLNILGLAVGIAASLLIRHELSYDTYQGMAVGYKALKAALANPVKSLRSE